MNRNQKIALGCGGAGCLGLIVAVIVGCLIYFFALRPAAYRASRNYNYNFNLNDNSYNSNSNSNDNSNANADSNANSDSTTSTSSMSDDDKHKLYYAATVTGKSDLINRVSVKIGLLNEDGTLKEGYQKFMADHASWAFGNLAFIREIGTPEKAQAYVDEHLE
jgi:hypothetical protein